MILYGILAAAIVAGDQLVKWWAVKALGPGGSWDVLPGIFSLTYAENQGAAFSILEGKRLFFVGMTVVMILLMLLLLKKGYIVGLWGKTAAAFVIGGALGNGIDRVLRGYVVDMFHVLFMEFAVFNVADICVVVGGIAAAVYYVWGYERLEKGLHPQEHRS